MQGHTRSTAGTPVSEIIDELARELRPLNTPGEVATVLRTTRRNIYRKLAAGELTAIQGRPGGALLIARASILAYLSEMAEG